MGSGTVKTLTSRRGGMLLMGLVLLAAAAMTMGFFASYSQNIARKRLFRANAKDALTFPVVEAVVAGVNATLIGVAKTASPTHDLISTYFPGVTTVHTLTLAKGAYTDVYNPSPGVVIVPLTGSPPPLIIGPENDPLVTITKTADHCVYKVDIAFQECSKVMEGRVQPASPGYGLGVNWTPACDPADIVDVSKSFFFNLRAKALAGQLTPPC